MKAWRTWSRPKREVRRQHLSPAQTATTSAVNVDIENTAWFVAAFPKEDPQIAVVVYIPNGLSGSSNALAVERIATWWFENRYTGA